MIRDDQRSFTIVFSDWLRTCCFTYFIINRTKSIAPPCQVTSRGQYNMMIIQMKDFFFGGGGGKWGQTKGTRQGEEQLGQMGQTKGTRQGEEQLFS